MFTPCKLTKGTNSVPCWVTTDPSHHLVAPKDPRNPPPFFSSAYSDGVNVSAAAVQWNITILHPCNCCAILSYLCRTDCKQAPLWTINIASKHWLQVSAPIISGIQFLSSRISKICGLKDIYYFLNTQRQNFLDYMKQILTLGAFKAFNHSSIFNKDVFCLGEKIRYVDKWWM